VSYVKKGGDIYELPLSDELEQLFALAPVDDDRPFLESLRGPEGLGRAHVRICDDTIREAWQRLKRRTGVNPELKPHDLRRTTADLAWEATHDLRIVQQLLGHKSMATTAEYLQHRDQATLRPLIQALKQFVKPKTESVQ